MGERESPLVAQPSLVDLGMVARQDALRSPLARGDADVAADRAHATDRRRLLDLPWSALEAVLRRRECSDRAQLDHVAAEAPVVRVTVESRDDRLRSAVDCD